MSGEAVVWIGPAGGDGFITVEEYEEIATAAANGRCFAAVDISAGQPYCVWRRERALDAGDSE